MERKVSEQAIVLKTMTASVKRPEEKQASLVNEMTQLDCSSEERMRRYGEHSSVTEKVVGKLVESVATCLVEKAVFMSTATLRWCLRDVSERCFNSEHLRKN